MFKIDFLTSIGGKMNILKKAFGEKIKQLRKSKGMTQKELGIKADMEYQYLGAIERGEKNPSLYFIEKIAVGLELKPYQLFMFKEEQKVDKEITVDETINLLKLCDMETMKMILEIVKIIYANKSV